MIKLAVSFMLIGLGAYGGGMVTIPLIQHELVQNRQWLKFDEMGQILAIAQITPGPIAINAATFTGYRLSGVPGALLATAAVILPSLLILSVYIGDRGGYIALTADPERLNALVGKIQKGGRQSRKDQRWAAARSIEPDPFCHRVFRNGGDQKPDGYGPCRHGIFGTDHFRAEIASCYDHPALRNDRDFYFLNIIVK